MNKTSPLKIDFLYFDAGGGHRAAATALKQVVEQQGRPWQVRLVNVQELLDSLDVFRKVTGIRLEDIYNQMLAKGWTLGSGAGLRFMQAVMRAFHGPAVQLLSQHWLTTQPDAVVSLIPNLNRALTQSLSATLPAVPYITILTDFADYPPHFWLERPILSRGAGQFAICGTKKAAQQARATGYPEDRIFRTSGMILRPRFYEPTSIDDPAARRAERTKLGLDPDRPVGLVLFGGQGSKVMADIAARLPDTQLILICGRNEALATQLRGMPAKTPRVVQGFTSEIPYFMRLADFFIGKPGPGSISEAVAMGLPVIVERNSWTMVQERYNTEWVREKGVGLVLTNFREIALAVDQLLRDLPRFQSAARSIENRAVFEIADIIADIIANINGFSNEPRPK